MNGKQFIEEANKLRNIMGLPLLKVKRPTILKYDDKISNNKDNIEYVVDALSKNQTTLFLGPTGSGKTNLISKVAEEIYKESKEEKVDIKNAEIIEDEELPFLSYTGNKVVSQGELKAFNEDGSINKDFIKNQKEKIHLLCNMTPSRVQNQQNEQIYYNFACIVAESKKLMEYDLIKEETAFSIVYDMVKSIIKAYEIEKSSNVELHISLIIDEAQELTLALNYREQAIKNMIEVSDYVKEHGGSVLLMTATPEPIIQLDVDDVVECVKRSGYKAPVENGYIILNKSKASISEFTYRELERMLNKGERPFINYNSKNVIKKLKEKFFFEGYNFLDFDGSQKKFSQIIDCTGKKHDEYDNEICEGVINKSSLPDKTKTGAHVDGWFVTNVMNVGTNVNNVGGIEDKKVNPIFTIFDERQSDANQIVQFLNRVRYPLNKNYVFMDSYEKADYSKGFYNADGAFIKGKKPSEDGYFNADGKFVKTTIVENIENEEAKKEIINKITDTYTILADGTVITKEGDKGYFNKSGTFIKGRLQAGSGYYDETGKYHFYRNEGQIDKNGNIILTDGTVIIEDAKNILAWSDKEDIIKREYKLLKKSIESFKLHIEAIKIVTTDKEDIIYTIEQFLNTKNKKGDYNDLDCIYIDHDSLEIKYDINNFWRHCYVIFQTQYFYYPEKLAERLENELGVNFTILDKAFIKNVDLTLKTEDEAKKFLKNAIGNKALINQIETNSGNNAELGLIKETEAYTDLKKLVRLGIDTSEAISIISDDNRSRRKAMRNIAINSIKMLKPKDVSTLEAAIVDTSILMSVKDETLVNNILRILNEKAYVQLINLAIKNDVRTEIILKKISERKSDSKIKESIIEEQYKKNNQYYIDKKEDYLSGITGMTQRIILDNLYVMNESGNLKATTIDETILNNINIQIKEKIGYESYSNEDIHQIIKYCFTLDKGKIKRLKK